MNNNSKKFLDVLRQSLFSSFTMLFAGIILGMLLIPIELDRVTHFVIMLLAMGLFTLGVFLQTKREQNTEKELKKDMNRKIDELNRRVTELENQDEPRSDNQQSSELS